MLTAFLMGLVVTLVSASSPAWRARNISPLDTLRVRVQPQGVPLGRYGWLVGVGLIMIGYLALTHIPLRLELRHPVLAASSYALLLGATLVVPVTIDCSEQLLPPILSAVYQDEGRLGATNLRRAKARTALTVAALMVGISVAVDVQIISTVYKMNLDNWVQAAYGADLYVRSAVPVCVAAVYGDLHIRPPTRMSGELGRRLLTEPTVEAVSPITCHLVRRVPFSGETDKSDILAFIGIDPATYSQVASFMFEDSETNLSAALAELSVGDALLISTTLADLYGLSTGDMLRLETRRGKRDFRVAGVVLDFSRQGYSVIGTRAALKRYFGESRAHEFLVALKPGFDARTEAERLEQRYDRGRQIVVTTLVDFREKVNDHHAQTCALFDVLALVGVIIATLGVVNTVMMNVFERQREIGGLRSMGMTRMQVIRMMLAESAAMGAIGGPFGLVLGFFLSKVSLLGLQVATGFRMEYTMPPVALILSLVIALLVSQVAAIYPAWYAANMRIIEAIQHE